MKVIGDLSCCNELGRNYYFLLIEPERTYAMKDTLSFGYLCLYSAITYQVSSPLLVIPQRAILATADVTRDILTMKQAAGM